MRLTGKFSEDRLSAAQFVYLNWFLTHIISMIKIGMQTNIQTIDKKLPSKWQISSTTKANKIITATPAITVIPDCVNWIIRFCLSAILFLLLSAESSCGRVRM